MMKQRRRTSFLPAQIKEYGGKPVGELIKLKSRLNEERDWVSLCDQYSTMLFRKDQQILSLTKQNELLYDEISRLQKMILGCDDSGEMSSMQQQ